MRHISSLLIAGLALASPAFAKKKPEKPEQVDIEALCPTLPPTGYRTWRGDASAAEAGDALRLARLNANEKAISGACEGLSPFQCAAIKRNVADWQQGYWNPKTQAACASVALKADWLKLFEVEMGKFDAHLGALLDRAVERLPDKRLRLDPPKWESGCVAGRLGEALSVEVQQKLGNYRDISIVDGDAPATALRLRLAPSGTGVALTAALGMPGGVSLPLPGFDFPLELFQVSPSEVGRCRADTSLGLVDGARDGSGGRKVWVTLPSASGVWCEGQQMEPFVAVNQASRVRVFDVTQAGEAYLVWPPPGEKDLVQSAVSLGMMDLLSLPEVGDERLLAIAVPPDGSFGALEGWQSYCKVSGIFGEDRYPGGAAVGSATFAVIPALQDECPAAPNAAAIKAQMPQFPTCVTQ